MRFLSLILIIFSLTGSLTADSVFSLDGFPERHYAVDAYSGGAGNASVADVYRLNAGYENPAVLGNIGRVLFSTSLTFGYYRFDDGISTFSEEGSYSPYFSIGVPLNNHKIGFSFSPYLSGNFDSRKSVDFPNESNPEGVLKATVINKLHANIYKASVLYAYDFNSIKIGLAADYYVGNRMQFYRLDFKDASYVDNREELDTDFHGGGFTIGLTKEWEKIAFGFVYDSYAKLSAEQKHITVTHQTTQKINDFELPHGFTFGTTYKITPQLKINTDFSYEMWKDSNVAQDFEDVYSLRGGLAYDPKWGYGYKWYERIPLRIGGYYKNNYFKTDNNKLFEKAFTCGISIPLSTPDKQIHLGFKYAVRNGRDTDSKDTDTLFTMGVTGFDFFKKRLKRTGHRDIPKADL
ncbi:MAG: hypothetical protein CSB55_00955 [Candidatus Cloacimonadota bacterium]|nr:MAG: hypothetical protein CSB55_00955 [Candidatus Cloacimonadota bacterium]